MKTKVMAILMVYAMVAIGLFGLRNAWITLLGFHITIIGAILIAKPGTQFSLLFKTRNIKWVILNVLLSGCSGIGLYFLWPHLRIANDLSTQLEALGLTKATWSGFIVYFSLVNPFIEEYFWRGYLGNAIKNFYINDFIYAGYHALILIGKVQFASIAFALIMLGVAAWFWRQVTRKDGGLLAAALGHLTADLSLLLTIRWMCS